MGAQQTQKEEGKMRKLRTLLPVAAVLTAVAGYMIASPGVTGSPAAAATPTPAAAAQLRLDIKFGADPRIDIPPPGPSVGDLHMLDDLLFKGGRQVGHTGGVCTLTDLARPEEACTITFSLPRGIITGQWLNTPPPHKVVAITGGTGIYRNVRGEARVVEFSSQRGAVTFLLIGAPASL
jgi:hypothetical protein